MDPENQRREVAGVSRIDDATHALWDALADIETSRVEHAREVLLDGLRGLVDAQHACWVGAVRMDETLAGDPVRGWRPRIVHHQKTPQTTGTAETAAREQVRQLEAGEVDLSTVRTVSFAGSWRTHRLVDLLPADWFEGEYYRRYYLGQNRVDAIWSGVPVNADVEIYVGLYRHCGHPPFSQADRETVAHAMRGLRWFHRQQVLGHGLAIGASPLTDLERRVLSGLLGGLTDKQIAKRLESSPRTVHEYASRIYRKYAVANRSALMALWLGQGG
ncbi:helix-turn-helix transcriptional regulator [Thermomonas brevis]|uniref:Helix-turn-helix transcriptional regulator n=1 Tax=Thermomonas brevis TaxID=215691 RepID=A0A7G9QRK7_9GAMM|nr:helix-turn-helix transcriptional regulator [Thermomonas brevis]